MKPRRHFLSRRLARRHARTFGLVCTLATTIVVHGADILRRGASSGNAPAGTTGTTNTPAPIAPRATGSSTDTLARTTQAIQSVQAMQTAARNLAKGGPNNLGANPTKPGQLLPDVPDGLAAGGLQVDSRVPANAALWQGANGPTQTTTSAGQTQVTITQTAQQAILNWNTFNIGKNTTLTFDQSAGGTNATQWIAFNKVNDPLANPTQILGSIQAAGQVYIINRNGIIFGGSSQINTHALVASTLPINDNLVDRGLLNNPDQQFLFSALALPAGVNGTPTFDPGLDPNTPVGDVVVQAGAQLTAPTSAANVGGRIALVGANVTNAGTISTPDGQTILAAGLQVGMVAHSSSDPSLRGLDVYVGAVGNPASSLPSYAGTVTNTGLIDSARANITLAGKTVNQLGAIKSTTSVSLNGRIDLLANYGAVGNIAFNSSSSSFGPSFLNTATGTVTFGKDSVTQILPELDSTDKVVGTQLALVSQVNITGNVIHFDDDAVLYAPNAAVTASAGTWLTVPAASAGSVPTYSFLRSGGRIDLDSGSVIDVSGSKNVASSVTSNIVEVQLRGTELADSPLQRDGALRGATIFVDITESGTYNGKSWIGTPLADVSGYVNLVQRTVGELTVAGGTVKLDAGDAVVVRDGAKIDVSGGTVNYAGGVVQTSRVMSGGKIFDITAATPDRVYDGVYDGTHTTTDSKWGVTTTTTNPLPINGTRYQAGFTQGGAGGALEISAASMALDGSLKGSTYAGPRQHAVLPAASTLSLSFSAERLLGGLPSTYYPAAPDITFSNTAIQTKVSDFATDGSGNPLALPADRISSVVLAPDILGTAGFGSLTLFNPDGNVTVEAGVTLAAAPGGKINFSAANITINGTVQAAGGGLSFTTYDVSPAYLAELQQSALPVVPPPSATRGNFTLGSGAVLTTAGSIVDDRPLSPTLNQTPVVTAGGSILVTSYASTIASGSLVDVSGGVYLSGTGKITYGNAGSISLLAGRDSQLPSITGGRLSLGGELRGYSGATGGSLALQALAIQVGGTAPSDKILNLGSGFFDQGGFSKFALSGIGYLDGTTTVAGMTIAAGTVINPTVSSSLVNITGDNQPVTLVPFVKPQALRSPLSLSFSSIGVVDDFTRVLKVRGDTFMGAGAVVNAGPLGSISLTGNTVEVHGSLLASGGSIKVGGAGKLPSTNLAPPTAYTTTLIGSDAVLDASGSTLLIPDPYGRRRGAVLAGGSIQVSGNIVAESGAVLNVSGASGTLDLLAGETGGSLDSLANSTSGTVAKPYQRTGKATVVASNGGTITLAGSEFLSSDATLVGRAGGATATGGTLAVSSGRFNPSTTSSFSPLDATLVVKASGDVLPSGYSGGIGSASPVDSTGISGGGRFAVDRFTAGGFSNLDLGGTVSFSGPVSIQASGRITAGTSPVLYADSTVSLSASRVQLGSAFQVPLTPDELAAFQLTTVDGVKFYTPPTNGAATLSVSASLIDVGYLATRGIGTVNLTAANGDIRGSGALEVAGDIHLTAGQIYAPTALSFTIAAFDYLQSSVNHQGSVTIARSGTRSLPLSAGGTLNVYGSVINQNGVLRAPFGTINLGWNGVGTAPHDNQLSNLDFAKTVSLVLGSQSVTSVSAIDPVTGKGITIPYGVSVNGTSWIDPRGVDITNGGGPQKAINLSGQSVVTESGSQVDIRGGGDLLAYRWVNGLGGTQDILADTGSFAIVPGYTTGYAPYAPFNTTAADASALGNDAGYVNGALKVGEQIRFDGGGGLPAGVYTLLPARYALLPGAYLVTPQSGTAIGTVAKPDGSAIVSGYMYDGLDSSLTVPSLAGRFIVSSSAVAAKRAEYTKLLANSFLTYTGGYRLPGDSGQLVLAATQAMQLQGSVLSAAGTGFRGGLIDISSPVDILISDSTAAAPSGTLVLSSSLLSSFGAESLLIGGVRSADADGTLVTATTGNLTVDNSGSPLTGSDIILVAKNHLDLAAGATITQTGTATGLDDTLVIGQTATAGSGNASFLRVSADANATLLRRGVTTGGATRVTVAAGTVLSGKSIAIDSTALNSLSSSASINAQALSLGSGRISLALDPSVTPGADAGLILTGSNIAALSSATSLALVSYSSIDLLGAGSVGGFDSHDKPLIDTLSLRAAEIRGIGTAGGTVAFNAHNILLDNHAGGTAGATLPGSGTLSFNSDVISLGEGALSVNGFAATTLKAGTQIKTVASGSLVTHGALELATPVVSGAQAVVYGISADGSLTITGTGSTGTVPGAGLGSSLSLTGSSVNVKSRVVMPSGEVLLHATTGDVNVSGSVEVGGISKTFKDRIQYTSGGHIGLTADLGNVTVGGSLDLSARPGGGDAGYLDVSAIKGGVSFPGTLMAAGGAGGKGGNFTLDVGSLASTASLDAVLNAAHFDQSRAYRVRTGNVAIDGLATTHSYALSADAGSVTLTNEIDASGQTGGVVRLVADGSLILASGSIIDASGKKFDDAGKGGSVTLETRGDLSGVVDIRTGSKIALGVAAWNASSAAAGRFQGTLHLRAPRNLANNDLAVAAINGTITNASNILVEGYAVYDLANYGGYANGVQSLVLANGQTFMGAAGATTANYTAITSRLLANNSGLSSALVLAPGAELINSATPAPVTSALNAVNSTLAIGVAGGVITFPTGTPGNSLVRSSVAGTITSSSGVVTTLAAGTATAIPAGSSITLTGSGTLTYVSGTGGAIALSLASGSSYTTGATSSVATVNTRGTSVSLNTAGTSSIALAVGANIVLPTGTQGNNTIRSTVAGKITSATGVVTTLAANTNTAVAAGSTITLNSAGTLSFPAGGTGGPVMVALVSGSFTTAGATTITPASRNIQLGSPTSTSNEDWNLATARFGPKSAPGVLTIRSAGNLVLNNSISDGFATSGYTSALLARNALLPDNIQSWSYRLVAGADYTAADAREVAPLSSLASTSGSLKLGKNGFTASVANGTDSLTSALLSTTSSSGLFQVIRTGSGDIDIVTARDVQLLNNFASIYTAGTLVADPTLGGTFDTPKPNLNGSNLGALGAIQQPTPAAVQYTDAGGNVSLDAGGDIIHLTLSSNNVLVADSSREMPVNWLYRRGYVDPATGTFGISKYGETASTSWWVDFTNFFEGVGALGGGNVTLTAGRDVTNVDAVAPTNARMPKGTPAASMLVELGGGDVTVRAGRNIDGGVYYVERGHGDLHAGAAITTNATRSPSLTNLQAPAAILDSSNWLPTTLFAGNADFSVSANGNVLLGPVANVFLLPQGYNNTYWYKTWFSTYTDASAVEVSSLGGSVSLRESLSVSSGASAATVFPALQLWFQNELLLTSNPASASYYQPWLRLSESSVVPFATGFSLMPGTLEVTAFSGSIGLTGNLTLSPSKTGTIDLFSAGAIDGFQKSIVTSTAGINSNVWTTSTINLSDADPTAIPSAASPFAYQVIGGISSNLARVTDITTFKTLDSLFAETGSVDGSTESKQALHASIALHAGDSNPVHLYSEGDISGLELFSGKASRIIAGQDIRDVSLYLQNVSANDISLVAAGRDLIAYDTTTSGRTLSINAGNIVAGGSGPLAGDIQISGPGMLEVFAGRNLDLGIGGNNADGTGTGITSIGNGRNPYLAFGGADITAAAGIGAAGSLGSSPADFTAFIAKYVKAGDGTAHLTELGLTQDQFDALDPDHQKEAALQVFYLVLRDTGRDHNKPDSAGFGNYDKGKDAIAVLFPGSGSATSTWKGDINTRARDIRTRNGGDISLFAPGGGLTLASTVIGNPLAPPGIITESGGNINVFTDKNVDLGISRIFTLKGGNEIIWSSNGNIAAGSSSKTVQSAPPTRVLIDPQSADVKTDLAGLATGGGIGVLTTVSGVKASDVDLIAPVGSIDAGDAGIRVSGNLNLAGAVIVNASNISVGGSSTGPASMSGSGMSLGSVTSPTNAANPVASPAVDAGSHDASKENVVADLASFISVEVIGYGGGDGDDDDDDKRKAKKDG